MHCAPREEQRKAKLKADAQEKQGKRQKAVEAETQAVRLVGSREQHFHPSVRSFLELS